MSDKPEEKGFGGLSSLASEVEENVPNKKSTSPKNSNKQKHEPQSQKSTRDQNKTNSKPWATWPSETSSSPSSPGSIPTQDGPSAAKWFWSILGLGILIAVLNSGEEEKSGSSTHSTYSSGRGEQSTSAPPTRTPTIEFIRPSTENNQVFSVKQIRWCLREEIRIETKRTNAKTDWEVDKFNSMVSDYNQRCGSFRYHRGALERARREVEAMRSKIVLEAQAESPTPRTPSFEIIPPSQSISNPAFAPPANSGLPKSKSTSPGTGAGGLKDDVLPSSAPATSSTRHRVNTKASTQPSAQDSPLSGAKSGVRYSSLTASVQRELNRLGYKAGPVDGLAGAKTRSAIVSYEAFKGLPRNGDVTSEILEMLKMEPTPNASSRQNFQQEKELYEERQGVYTSPYEFTEGSTEETLIQIHGEPDSIRELPSYREVWTYGISSVYLSSRTRRVLGWNNNGELKARRTIIDPRKKERIRGDLANVVEKLARDSNCVLDGQSNLLSVNGSLQYYQVFCTNGPTLRARCAEETCSLNTNQR